MTILIPWCPKHQMQAMVCMNKNSHDPEDVIEAKEVPEDYYGVQKTITGAPKP